ncbi:hypothetical protein ABZ682_26855 [Streptomyces griseoviridis]|uniref:hypothetical protein n=1 Tax=Streptomyces griseoviridis TaxID=45398 RepID=UPI0033C4368F
MSPEDVDFARGVLRRRRQVQLLVGRLYFTLSKGGSEPDRETKKFPLVITTTYGNALRANIFNVEVWKPALAAAGVIPVRQKGERWKASGKDGFQVLRHTYASVILEAGESVVTLARWPAGPLARWPAGPLARPFELDDHPGLPRPLHAGGPAARGEAPSTL